MRLKTSVVALILSLAVLAAPRVSFATPTLPETQVTLTLKTTDGSIYPYGFNVNGSGPIIDLSCLNDTRTVQVNETWAATEVNLGALITYEDQVTGSTTLANKVKIDGSSLLDLEEDAYLDSLYTTSTYTDSLYTNTEIQDAIWSIVGNPIGTSDSKVDTLIKDAGYSVTGIDSVGIKQEPSSFYSQFTFYFPTSSNEGGYNGEPQQFMGYTPTPTVTPEPSSLILLGTGLLGGVGAIRRRIKKG